MKTNTNKICGSGFTNASVTGSVTGQNYHVRLVRVPIPGQTRVVSISTAVGPVPGASHTPRCLVVFLNSAGERTGSNIDLTGLAKLYLEATGKEMKATDIVISIGYDTNLGPYIDAIVIPLDSPNGSVVQGIPALGFTYSDSQRGVFGGNAASLRRIN